MLLLEFLTAFAVGLLIVFLFGGLLGRRGPWVREGSWSGVFWFFLIVFLGAWAVGAWTTPIGPVVSGVAWVPFLFGALVFGFLLAGLSEPRPRVVTPAEAAAETEAQAIVGAFFWILVILLAVAIIVGSI
ncbi:MAG TPA: hypothetical protein VJ925_08470 [Longimicrobiales bacterium]|nr:hypothetical protein [Longimicrobiales bacterium]